MPFLAGASRPRGAGAMPDPVFQQALTLLSGSKYAELNDLTLWVHEQRGQQENGIGHSSL